jgi:hypothetical protein
MLSELVLKELVTTCYQKSYKRVAKRRAGLDITVTCSEVAQYTMSN